MTALFDMICTRDGVITCGNKLDQLKGALEEEGITWTEELTDAFASNDVDRDAFRKVPSLPPLSAPPLSVRAAPLGRPASPSPYVRRPHPDCPPSFISRRSWCRACWTRTSSP